MLYQMYLVFIIFQQQLIFFQSLLPGDDCYPSSISSAESISKRKFEKSDFHEVDQSNVTVEEFGENVKNFNRVELKSRTNFNIRCNQQTDGHFCLNFFAEDFVNKGMHTSLL